MNAATLIVLPVCHRFAYHDVEGCHPRFISRVQVEEFITAPGRDLAVALGVVGKLRALALPGSVVRRWLLEMDRLLERMRVARRHSCRRSLETRSFFPMAEYSREEDRTLFEAYISEAAT